MMRHTRCRYNPEPDAGLTSLIEYISVTGVLMVMLIVVMFAVNTALIESPSDTLRYHHFTDIGNGVSVRIVDLYVVAPGNGVISTKFDLPNDVAGDDYFVQLEPGSEGVDQRIMVTDWNVQSTIALSGIGATRPVTGETTGGGFNVITYDSRGFT